MHMNIESKGNNIIAESCVVGSGVKKEYVRR